MSRLPSHTCESGVGHLGPDGVGRDSVRHRSQLVRMRRRGVLYVPMIMARTPMIKQPPNPNALGELMIILVMPAKAPMQSLSCRLVQLPIQT